MGTTLRLWIQKDHSQVSSEFMIEVSVKPMNIPDGEAISKIVIHMDLSLSDPKASAQTGVKIDMKTWKMPVTNLMKRLNLKLPVNVNTVRHIAFIKIDPHKTTYICLES